MIGVAYLFTTKWCFTFSLGCFTCITMVVLIQGILQAYRKSVTPLFISLLRLIIIIVPIALIIINFENAKDVIW